MNAPRSLLAVVVVLLVGHGVANAVVRKGPAHVRFVAIGPMGMKIEGNSTTLDVKDDGHTAVIAVPLAPLKTGIGLRDRHMRDEYLEVSRFPDARLAVDDGAARLPDDKPAVDAAVRGKLTLHGQTRAVLVHYHAARSRDGIDVTGTLHIDMTDYGIRVPSYYGVTVKPGVDIDVEFQVQR